MRRIMSIWLPQLPLDRRTRLGDTRTEDCFAIISEIKSAWRLTHLSKAAYEAGLSVGMSLSDGRAICPNLISEPTDHEREQSMLRALRRWADQLSPIVSLDQPDGLLLDITGCAHLFGGERNMAVEAVERFTSLQITSRIGIADTKRAAWALARFGPKAIMIAESARTKDALANLPLAGLNLPAKTISDLGRTGLKQIGQLYGIKSGELARRFGLALTKSLAAAMGHEPDPIAPTAMEILYAARKSLPEPIGFQSDLLGVLQQLAASVCGRLQADGKGARRYRLIVRCVDTGDHGLPIGFARPVNNSQIVIQQFEHPLDKLKIEYGADWFRLVAEQVEPIQPTQGSMSPEARQETDLDRIISTLGNRLGFDRVKRFQPNDSHLPELEFSAVEAATIAEPYWRNAPRSRPLRLFVRPERLRAVKPGRPPKEFEWRKTVYQTERATGPERLVPEWWRRGDKRSRDYWRVQTRNGPRLWLMNYPASQQPDWYVAGRFP